MAKREGDRKASIEGGRLVRCSPTQVTTALDPDTGCLRRWAYIKVEKLPTKPMGKGAALGDRLHGEVEHYLLTGEDVRSSIALAGRDLLAPYLPRAPFNKGDMRVEGSLSDGVKLLTPGGVEMVGYIDVYLPELFGKVGIIDHKFKKNLEQYGSSEKKLATDPQRIIYTAWAALQSPDAAGIFFTLHEHQTQGSLYAKPVQAFTPTREAAPKWAELAHRIDTEIAPLAGLPDASEVTPNVRACEAFGRCDFYNTCPHSPGKRSARAFMEKLGLSSKENKNMGLLSNLNVKPNTPPPAAAPPPAAVALNQAAAASVAASAPPQAVLATARRVQVQNATPGKKYIHSGQVLTFETMAGPAGFFTDAAGAPRKLLGGEEVTEIEAEVIAPAAAAPVATMPAMPASTMIAPEVRNTTPAPVVQAPAAAAPAAAPTPAPAAEAAPASTEKPKRGRPAGSKNKGATEGTQVSDLDTEDDRLILIVDGIPSKPATDLNAWVVEKASEMAKAAGVVNIRCAPKDSPLAYSGWKGALAEKVLEAPPSGLCTISRTELTEPVIEALSSIAILTVRG